MKNKLTLLYLAMAVFTNGCALGQFPEYKWTATVKVAGEDGTPVVGADVSVSYSLFPPPTDRNAKQYGEIKGMTDTNGIFIASHADRSWGIGIHIEKTGYYFSHVGHELYRPGQVDEHRLATNRNPTIFSTLKKIGQPIAMYAKSLNLEMPVLGKAIGYDLMVGDWVAPYGKGNAADILLKKEYAEKSSREYYSVISVTFPKLGDGIQVFPQPASEQGSELRSPHAAPTNDYLAELTREIRAQPGQPNKFEYDPKRIYFFRMRTVLDEKGNVKSALYGKIYGDFMQFKYYLNPTPNDRNLEYDPKQNLLKNLSDLEQVREP